MFGLVSLRGERIMQKNMGRSDYFVPVERNKEHFEILSTPGSKVSPSLKFL
jgi:hypothetical protein